MSDDTLDTGITTEQLDKESELSQKIQQDRAHDPHMALQMTRAAMDGDIGSLSQAQREALFNPDGNLPQQVVEQRIADYQREHSKLAFAPGEQRRQVAGVGLDTTTNQHRMPSAGERVNPDGVIEMVDSRYADQVAEKLRNANELDVKNSMRRSEALNQVVMQCLNRTQDPSGVVHVTFEEERALAAQYDYERSQKWPEWRHDYLPMRAYMHKIGPRRRSDGTYTKPMRTLLANEAGTFQMGSNPSSKLQGKIVCVRDKDLTHQSYTQVQVPQTYQGGQAAAPMVPQARPMVPQSSQESTLQVQAPRTPPSSPSTALNPTVGSPQPISPSYPQEDPNKDLPPPPPGFKST